MHAVKFAADLTAAALPKTFAALSGYKAASGERLRDPNTGDMVVLQASAGETPVRPTCAAERGPPDRSDVGVPRGDEVVKGIRRHLFPV